MYITCALRVPVQRIFSHDIFEKKKTINVEIVNDMEG